MCTGSYLTNLFHQVLVLVAMFKPGQSQVHPVKIHELRDHLSQHIRKSIFGYMYVCNCMYTTLKNHFHKYGVFLELDDFCGTVVLE